MCLPEPQQVVAKQRYAERSAADRLWEEVEDVQITELQRRLREKPQDEKRTGFNQDLPEESNRDGINLGATLDFFFLTSGFCSTSWNFDHHQNAAPKEEVSLKAASEQCVQQHRGLRQRPGGPGHHAVRGRPY